MAHGLELRVPLLDHHWYQNLLALSAEERFTKPRSCSLRGRAGPVPPWAYSAKKSAGSTRRCSNGCKAIWRRGFPAGERLSETTARQLDPNAVNAMVERYKQGARHMAEQILQLLILDESLRQLRVSGGQGRANRRVALGQVGAA